MHTMIRRLSFNLCVARLLLCLLALAALAHDAAAQSVSPTFTLTGDLQSLTDSWASWGRDPINSRFNPFATRIRRSNVNRLRLKWAFAFPDGVTSASSQPAVVGDTLYVGGWNAKVYALDRETGATKWTYDTADFTGSVEGGGTQLPVGFNAVRDAPAVSDGKLYFGDVIGNVDALDARTGAFLWARKIDSHFSARIVGSPLVFRDRVFIGLSSVESGYPIDPTYPCCTFRGKLVALDAATGRIVWQRQLSMGGQGGLAGIQWGTSWDGERIYVSTHDAQPGTLFALNPSNGQVLWSKPNPADGCDGKPGRPLCRLALPAATTTIPGIVFQGSWDGHLRAHDSRNGQLLWQYDTYRAYAGVNGYAGQGGSINGAGAVVVGDTVYVNSGYSAFGPGTSLAGNVLLAFSIDGN